MADIREVVVLSAMRTPVGSFGGTLKDFNPCDLGTIAVKAAIEKSGVKASDIGELVFGNVIHTERRDMYVSRVVAVNSGMTQESTALTLNRLCGSGLQAIITAAQEIMVGDVDIAVGGGVEVMSRSGYCATSERWGARMGDSKMVDMMVGALTDPFSTNHMGVTAENIATKFNITREQQDAFAVDSQKKAIAAIKAGYFKSQIAPVEIQGKKGVVSFDTDEYPKADASIEGMAKLKAAFKKDGTVTPANASGINDGAAAMVLMEAKAAKKAGLKPIARIVSYAVAGVDPNIMGTGPIPAVTLALKRANLKVSDIDLFEANEAFAAQAISVNIGLKLDTSKVNPNGGAIAIGHPLGASGAIVAVKTVHELQRTGKKYGIATLCIGGGQGIAVIFERM